DGKTLLATELGRIRFLNPTTGKECRHAVESPGLDHLASPGFNILSPDGRRLAYVKQDWIGVWDLTTGKQMGPAGLPHSWVDGVAFSPDGKTLATNALPGGAYLWDAASGKLLTSVNREPLKFGDDAWRGVRPTKNGLLYSCCSNSPNLLGAG